MVKKFVDQDGYRDVHCSSSIDSQSDLLVPLKSVDLSSGRLASAVRTTVPLVPLVFRSFCF